MSVFPYFKYQNNLLLKHWLLLKKKVMTAIFLLPCIRTSIGKVCCYAHTAGPQEPRLELAVVANINPADRLKCLAKLEGRPTLCLRWFLLVHQWRVRPGLVFIFPLPSSCLAYKGLVQEKERQCMPKGSRRKEKNAPVKKTASSKERWPKHPAIKGLAEGTSNLNHKQLAQEKLKTMIWWVDFILRQGSPSPKLYWCTLSSFFPLLPDLCASNLMYKTPQDMHASVDANSEIQLIWLGKCISPCRLFLGQSDFLHALMQANLQEVRKEVRQKATRYLFVC